MICTYCNQYFPTINSLTTHLGANNACREFFSKEINDAPFSLAEDPINHPVHYTNAQASCPKCKAAVECIDVTRHLNFNLGNAIKYIWRCDSKGNPEKDLQKAIWYLQDEIKRRGHKEVAS